MGIMEADVPAPALVEIGSYTPEQARRYCDYLEQGKVLFFRTAPFNLPEEDRTFLLAQKQAESRFHKNISYRPASDALKGFDSSGPDRERLHRIMQMFSQTVTAFVARFLAPYAGKFVLDYASFRPLEEKGRDLPLHKRNDLLHVDAFPTRPTMGARIMRVFLNVNPYTARIWNVGEPFHIFFPKLRATARISPPRRNSFTSSLTAIGARLGLPGAARSSYDDYMLYLHDWLKENSDFQSNAPRHKLEFPPGCCWMVYTDGVPHAVVSGQFALEQTLIVPARALVNPEAAPVRVLESSTGLPMAS